MAAKVSDQIREQKATAADLDVQNRPAGAADMPQLAYVAPGFVRVLRDDPARPEVVHTPGEMVPADVRAGLSAGQAHAGADGVLVLDLRAGTAQL